MEVFEVVKIQKRQNANTPSRVMKKSKTKKNWYCTHCWSSSCTSSPLMCTDQEAGRESKDFLPMSSVTSNTYRKLNGIIPTSCKPRSAGEGLCFFQKAPQHQRVWPSFAGRERLKRSILYIMITQIISGGYRCRQISALSNKHVCFFKNLVVWCTQDCMMVGDFNVALSKKDISVNNTYKEDASWAALYNVMQDNNLIVLRTLHPRENG